MLIASIAILSASWGGGGGFALDGSYRVMDKIAKSLFCAIKSVEWGCELTRLTESL